MGTLSLKLFGNFQALLDGQPSGTFRTNKAQALLVYLAVEHKQTHRREGLMTLLWPDMPLPSAQVNLRQVLYRLRQMFPDLLLSSRQTVRLNPDAALEVDLHRFDALIAQVERHAHPSLAGCTPCREALEEAMVLYRGDFLADFYLDDSNEFEEWAEALREQYRGKALDALENLGKAALAVGKYEQAVEAAERQLGIDPLRESAHRGLMEALARDGRRRAALAHYADFQTQLHAELGVVPSQETQRLVAAIRKEELEPVPTPVDAPTSPLEPTAGHPAEPQVEISIRRHEIRHNLPTQPTPFIGRETELASLDKLLADPAIRLVTIVGPGGMGKTRLALACAERQLASMDGDPGNMASHPYADGIFFVDLAPLNEPAQIALAVVEALQIKIGGGDTGTPQEQLLAYLADKGMLFVLDNFEHLIAGADLVAEILRAAPGVQIIVTSRERLRLHGEHLFQIPGLEFPDWIAPEDAAEYTAAQLFLDASRRAQPDFELADDDLPHLTRICQLVGGMPLALELAAGWVELLPLAEIAAEIERGLGLLETDLQDVPDRHRSIQAVFEATWERLEPAERNFMQKLSVFRGGFTREAAGQVVASQHEMATTLRVLSRLVSKSLLQVNPTGKRYQIHELLRQYAFDRLEGFGELEATQSAHTSYYLDLLRGLEAEIKGGRKQKDALDMIEVDFNNIRAGWAWALDQGHLDHLNQVLDTLYWFCRIRNREIEGFELYMGIEAAPCFGSDRNSNTIWRRSAARRICLDYRTGTEIYLKNRVEIDRILAAARQEDDQAEVAFALYTLGRTMTIAIDEPSLSSIKNLEKSQSICHDLGDTFFEGWLMGEISWLYMENGQPEKRVEMINQQFELARNNGDRLTAADAQGVLGFIAERAGHYMEAERIYQEVLVVFREYGNRWHICEYQIRLGELAFLKGKGKSSRAMDLLTNGQVLARQYNQFFFIHNAYGTLGMILSAEERYIEAVQCCQEIPWINYIQQAFARPRGLTYAMCGLDDFSAARKHLAQALEKAAFYKAPGWQVQMLPAAALIAASEDQLERTAELLALGYHHPAAATGWQDQFPLITRLRAELDHTLGPAAFQAAWERGKALDLEETITALLEEPG